MRILWILLGLLGLAGVALGAYASHGKAFADAYQPDVYEVAVRYHLVHLPALGIAALIGSLVPPMARRAGIAGALFLAGMALFCGSLYLKGIGAADLTNPTAPTGGFLLMAGWLALAWAGLGIVRSR
ncbi:MAG: DUF423 domain-containing protein [Kiloniellaceae bacterium]